MDGRLFDAMTKTLAAGTSSRRRTIGGLAAGAVGLALSRLGLADTVAKEAAATRGGCRNEKNECKRDSQCCSGVCRKKKCRRAPTQRTCTIKKNACEAVGGATGCGTTNGGDPCSCVVTASGASFCGDLASGECVPCIGSGDCAAVTGPGSACVRAVGNCLCNDGGETLCLPPCNPDSVAGGGRVVAGDADRAAPLAPTTGR